MSSQSVVKNAIQLNASVADRIADATLTDFQDRLEMTLKGLRWAIGTCEVPHGVAARMKRYMQSNHSRAEMIEEALTTTDQVLLRLRHDIQAIEGRRVFYDELIAEIEKAQAELSECGSDEGVSRASALLTLTKETLKQLSYAAGNLERRLASISEKGLEAWIHLAEAELIQLRQGRKSDRAALAAAARRASAAATAAMEAADRFKSTALEGTA